MEPRLITPERVTYYTYTLEMIGPAGSCARMAGSGSQENRAYRECDEDGNPLNILDKYADFVRAEIQSRRDSPDWHVYIRPWEQSEQPTRIMLCCGRELPLARFTNTCDRCGCMWNQSGQSLAPVEHWGEETGEHWSDLVGGDLEPSCCTS